MGEQRPGKLLTYSGMLYGGLHSRLILIWVQRLRYKDYHLASRPDAVRRETQAQSFDPPGPGLLETDSVKDFGARMGQRGVLLWWRKAMGYERSDHGS